MTEILLVDDDSGTLLALPEALRLRLPSVNIETCERAYSALEKLAQKDVDLLITDWQMPDMNGLELLRAAKRIKPSMPCIVITGHGGFEFLRLATKAGAFEVLSKPLDRDVLLQTVNRALGTRHNNETRQASDGTAV